MNQFENEQKNMKDEMAKMKEKVDDLNVFDLLKNNLGDSNIDVAQGLIMNLENKITKKLEFYELKLKKDEEDIFQNKNDIKNMNNIIDGLKNMVNKNKNDIDELKNREGSNNVEIRQFVNEISNKTDNKYKKMDNKTKTDENIILAQEPKNEDIDIKDDYYLDNNIGYNPDNNYNNSNINNYANTRINRNKNVNNTNNNITPNNVISNDNNRKDNKNLDNIIYSNNNEQIIKKIGELESKIIELQKNYEILKLSNNNDKSKPSQESFSQDQLKILKDISSRTNDLENKMETILAEVNMKAIYDKLETLEDNLNKKGSKFEIAEVKEKLSGLDEREKDLNFKIEQLQKFMEKIRGDMQQIIKNIEYLSGQVNRMSSGSSDQNKGKGSIIDITKYVDFNSFNEKNKEINNKFDKVRLSFEEVARNIDDIFQKLSHTPTDKDFSQFQSLIRTMIDDMKLSFSKKYADKNEITKSIKLLETQIKTIQESLQKRVDGADNWLLAKKPFGLCTLE